jgi:spermidine dehydrogenase
MHQRDRELGMDRAISRRDFLDGVAMAVGATALGPWAAGGGSLGAQTPAPYPPALTGLRGSHPGSFEIFHAVRDGRFWGGAPNVQASGEEYDLVVVGAGISGLAAAHYTRKAKPGATVLLLDNHDDFGGHAKRNEFSHGGRQYLGYGGTQSIDSPSAYSATAQALIAELGIDVRRYRVYLDTRLHRAHGLHPAMFFDKETFGVDKLVVGTGEGVDQAIVAAAPLSDAVRRDLTRLATEQFDPYPGESSASKKAKLAKVSYADFITKLWKLDPGVVKVYQSTTHSLFGAGIDAVPAQDAFGLGLPGFQGMGLAPGRGPGQNHDAIRTPEGARYYFHFPDGNASIARLLVRRLIPAAIPGRTAEDVVTARADYAKLDVPGSPVRIRLSSPVVRVRHQGDPATARGVEVTYAAGDRLKTVRAKTVIFACWHAPIPFLCPDLPTDQKKALSFAIKVPLIYTNVLIRNWSSFKRLGVSGIEVPNGFYSAIALDAPVSIGGYRHPKNPAEPIVLHLSRSVCKPGYPIRDQHRLGRIELFSMPFEILERRTRDQLGRVLGPGGFDPAADILGITVNRWPHGYAYQYNSLWDDFWFRGEEGPCAVARRRFGRIAIANADAGAYSYTDAAIDHAHRAVGELAQLS